MSTNRSGRGDRLGRGAVVSRTIWAAGILAALVCAGIFLAARRPVDALVLASSAAAQDLLKNGGFEEADRNFPRDWVLDSKLKSKGELKLSTKTFASGQRALELNPNSRNTDPNNLFGVAQLVRLDAQAGKRLTLEAAMRATDGAEANVGLVGFASGGGSIRLLALLRSREESGFKVERSDIVVPQDVPLVGVACLVGGTQGVAWFDDVRLSVEAVSERGSSTSGSAMTRENPRVSAPADLGSTPVWEKHSGNPVFMNYAKEADKSFVADPGVLYYDGSYYMWYGSLLHGRIPDAVPYGPCNFKPGDPTCAVPMGMATSKDGIHWVKFDNGTPDDLKDDYVVMRDSAHSWDSLTVETPTVVYDDSARRFRMWYAGTGTGHGTMHQLYYSIGYAESSDGVHWKKYDDPATTDKEFERSDPVMKSRKDKWDKLWVSDPSVIKDGDTYKMWYAGGATKLIGIVGAYVAIGYAESKDGIHWTRRDKPVLAPTNKEGFLNGPEVVKRNGRFEMWYYTRNEPGVFYAVSNDGLQWERRGLAVGLGRDSNWDDSAVSSPAVLVRDGVPWVYYCGSRCPLEERERKSKCQPHSKIGIAIPRAQTR